MNAEQISHPERTPEKINVPAPTAWPIILALGLTLVSSGLVTAASVSLLGAVLALTAVVGWFREVLPVESREWAPVVRGEFAVQTAQKRVERITAPGAVSRAWLPVEIYPISAGITGGLAGGAVMALLAAVYGIFSGNGIWYPINLLSAGLFPAMATETARQIGTLNLYQLLVAVSIHLAISLLVGLLYGSMLPMVPRHPILLGGLAAPLLWTGVIYGILAFVNPLMNQRIDWLWFVLSQIGFGITAGLLVARQERIPNPANIPLIVRIGIEAPGLGPEHPDVKR